MHTRLFSAVSGNRLFHGLCVSAMAILAAGVMLFAIPQAGAAFKYVRQGSDVPDFTLTALDGSTVSLASLKEGKAAVILFWATWSPRAIEEMKFVEALFKEHKSKGLLVVGINVNHMTYSYEDQQAVQKAIAETGVTFPIVLDKGLEVYNNFGVVATPSTILLNPTGQIVYEVSSFLTFTSQQIKENVEIALGLAQAPVKAAEEKLEYKPVRKAMLYFNLGRNLLKMGSRDKAVDKLIQAAAEDPKYAAPRVLLGHLYLDGAAKDPKAVDAACKLFEEAVASEAKNVSAVTGLGECRLRTNKLDEAEARFKEAAAIDGTYTPAISGLGSVLSKQGKYEEAIAKFKEALELNPLNPDAYQRRAVSYENRGMLKEAAHDFRKAVQILLGFGLEDSEV